MAATMAKKKPAKAALYVEIPADLKQRLDKLAERRMRKLNAEVTIALQKYVEAEEKADGLKDDKNPPEDEPEDD